MNVVSRKVNEKFHWETSLEAVRLFAVSLNSVYDG